MTTAHFSREFAAAHRVWNDGGKCANIHGHNYRVEVALAASALTPQNFVVPFDAIKQVIDAFDHTLILDRSDELAGALRLLASDDPDGVFARLAVTEVEGVPSTEFLAQLIADRIVKATVRAHGDVEASAVVELRETAGIMAKGFAST